MNDDFGSWDENSQINNKEKLNNVLWFIPFLNVWMLFVDKKEVSEATKRLNRLWVTLFLIYIVVFILASFIGLWFLITIAYVVAIIFFAIKAYNWIYVEVDFLEKLIEKFVKKSK